MISIYLANARATRITIQIEPSFTQRIRATLACPKKLGSIRRQTQITPRHCHLWLQFLRIEVLCIHAFNESVGSWYLSILLDWFVNWVLSKQGFFLLAIFTHLMPINITALWLRPGNIKKCFLVSLSGCSLGIRSSLTQVIVIILVASVTLLAKQALITVISVTIIANPLLCIHGSLTSTSIERSGFSTLRITGHFRAKTNEKVTELPGTAVFSTVQRTSSCHTQPLGRGGFH